MFTTQDNLTHAARRLFVLKGYWFRPQECATGLYPEPCQLNSRRPKQFQ